MSTDDRPTRAGYHGNIVARVIVNCLIAGDGSSHGIKLPYRARKTNIKMQPDRLSLSL